MICTLRPNWNHVNGHVVRIHVLMTSFWYLAKNVGEQLIIYINLVQCYLDAETVPIYKLCSTYQKKGISSQKRCLEGTAAYMKESNRSKILLLAESAGV